MDALAAAAPWCAVGGYPYGSGVFEMKQASTAATPTPASPAQAASAPPSPAAAAPAAEPTGSSEEQGDGSVDAAAAPSPAPSPANSGGSGCTLQLAEGAAAESFTGCTLVSGVGSNFHVMWRTEAVASNPAVSSPPQQAAKAGWLLSADAALCAAAD